MNICGPKRSQAASISANALSARSTAYRFRLRTVDFTIDPILDRIPLYENLLAGPAAGGASPATRASVAKVEARDHFDTRLFSVIVSHQCFCAKRDQLTLCGHTHSLLRPLPPTPHSDPEITARGCKEVRTAARVSKTPRLLPTKSSSIEDAGRACSTSFVAAGGWAFPGVSPGKLSSMPRLTCAFPHQVATSSYIAVSRFT